MDSNSGIPQVIKYLKIYYWVLIVYSVLWLLFSIFGFTLLSINADSWGINSSGKLAIIVSFIALIVSFLISLALTVFTLMWSNKKTKFAYYLEMVMIIMGFFSLITLLPCIYFLVQWLKPEVKNYYGVQ
jgi:hypothetical protein